MLEIYNLVINFFDYCFATYLIEIVNYSILVLMLCLAGISNAGMDVLQFNPKTFVFQTDWWLIKGRFAWNERPWYTKFIFTMVSDGWHLLKFLNIISYIVAIFLFSIEITNIPFLLIAIVAGYTVVGSAFEIGYNYLWRL